MNIHEQKPLLQMNSIQIADMHEADAHELGDSNPAAQQWVQDMSNHRLAGLLPGAEVRVDELTERVDYDYLTKQLSKEKVDEILDARIKNKLPTIVVAADIDGFKDFNDSYGHLEGDTLLKTWAAWLDARLKRSTDIGRTGGDESVIIIAADELDESDHLLKDDERNPSIHSRAVLEAEFTEQTFAEFRARNSLDNTHVRNSILGLSAGAAYYDPTDPSSPQTRQELLAAADLVARRNKDAKRIGQLSTEEYAYWQTQAHNTVRRGRTPREAASIEEAILRQEALEADN